MLPILHDKMFPNRFVETQLPTKGQIFDRTGKSAVAPNGVYTKDDPALIGLSQTQMAERFLRDAESYVKPEPPKPSDNADKE